MPSPARSAIAPLYLFACLILGGSAQGIWENLVLQLAGIAIIACAIAMPVSEPIPRAAKLLLIIAGAAILVVALQEVPLPPTYWEHGSRAALADGFRLLGKPVPALPTSLAPYSSASALLGIIPPLAMFCAIVGLRAYRPSWLAAALLAGTVCGVMLGALQVASASASRSWYLYPETNIGLGVGFFANANHMADLLVITLPFLAAIAAAGKSRNIQGYSALLSVLAGVALVMIVGIALNGSLAGFALVTPVFLSSLLIVLPPPSRLRGLIVALAGLSVLVAVAGLGSSSIGGTKIGQEATGSVQSREQILATTGKAIADYMPFGSGLGTFAKVYRLYESPDAVTNEYVIHAHNDYAEVALELGVAGAVLMLLFLAWWVVTVSSVWRNREVGPFARAASIATAAILIHSLVDFPLRTAAISGCFAMCLALIADRRAAPEPEADELRPTRHIVIG